MFKVPMTVPSKQGSTFDKRQTKTPQLSGAVVLGTGQSVLVPDHPRSDEHENEQNPVIRNFSSINQFDGFLRIITLSLFFLCK